MPQSASDVGEAPHEPATPQRVVPTDSWPSLALAVADAADGTFIRVLAGHAETLAAPLIIDHNLCIEGPAEGSARLFGEESVVVAAGKAKDAVFLRRLKLECKKVPALVIAGACTVERCTIEGADVGVEVAAHAGSVVRIQHSFVHDCRIGISLAGGSEAVLEGTRIQQCGRGVAVTGLTIEEGWNQTLGSLARASFLRNAEADLVLRAWAIRTAGRGRSERHLAATEDGEVVVRGWPTEACSVVAPLEGGAAVLHFSGGNVNATLFDEDGADESERESPCVTPASGSCGVLRQRLSGAGVVSFGEEETGEDEGEAPAEDVSAVPHGAGL